MTKEDAHGFVCINSKAAFDRWCKEGGWSGVDDFENDTGVCFAEIRGKKFQVVGGRVFTEEKD